jgi:hypothetical protein
LAYYKAAFALFESKNVDMDLKLNYCHTTEAIPVDQKESIAGRAKRNISIFAKVKLIDTTKDRCLRRLADLIRVTLSDELAVLLLYGSGV